MRASPIAIWGGRPVHSLIDSRWAVIERPALESARTPRSRVLLLNSPWNPTGTVFTRTELQTCMDFAIEHGLTILSDEIYEKLIYDGGRHISPASLSAEAMRGGGGQQFVERTA